MWILFYWTTREVFSCRLLTPLTSWLSWGYLSIYIYIYIYIYMSQNSVRSGTPFLRISILAPGHVPEPHCSSVIKVSKVKVVQSCPTIFDPMNSIIHGIFQAWILEWDPFAFYRGSFKHRDWTQVSHISGGFFTSWATREVLYNNKKLKIWTIS